MGLKNLLGPSLLLFSQGGHTRVLADTRALPPSGPVAGPQVQLAVVGVTEIGHLLSALLLVVCMLLKQEICSVRTDSEFDCV